MNGPASKVSAGHSSAEADASLLSEAERPRVLLVDDDERNLLAVATVLEDLGEVVLARSGEEALRHLASGVYRCATPDEAERFRVLVVESEPYRAAGVRRPRHVDLSFEAFRS